MSIAGFPKKRYEFCSRFLNSSGGSVVKDLRRVAAAMQPTITLSVLLVLLVVIVDLGLVLRAHQVVSDGSRGGARFSALPKNYIGTTNPSASSSAIKHMEHWNGPAVRNTIRSRSRANNDVRVDTGRVTLMGVQKCESGAGNAEYNNCKTIPTETS